MRKAVSAYQNIKSYALFCVGLATCVLVLSGSISEQPVQVQTAAFFEAQDFTIQSEITDQSFSPTPQLMVEPAAGAEDAPQIFLYESKPRTKIN